MQNQWRFTDSVRNRSPLPPLPPLTSKPNRNLSSLWRSRMQIDIDLSSNWIQTSDQLSDNRHEYENSEIFMLNLWWKPLKWFEDYLIGLMIGRQKIVDCRQWLDSSDKSTLDIIVAIKEILCPLIRAIQVWQIVRALDTNQHYVWWN